MLMNTLIHVASVVFFPIVSVHKRTALIYLSAMVVEVTLMTLGALALLMTIPLAREAGRTGSPVTAGPTGWATWPSTPTRSPTRPVS